MVHHWPYRAAVVVQIDPISHEKVHPGPDRQDTIPQPLALRMVAQPTQLCVAQTKAPRTKRSGRHLDEMPIGLKVLDIGLLSTTACGKSKHKSPKKCGLPSDIAMSYGSEKLHPR